MDDNGFSQRQEFDTAVSALIKQLELSVLIGSSNGLLGLYGYNKYRRKMFVIWNPSIRKSVGVVVPLVSNSPFKTTKFGFGVCPITCDPTVLMVSYLDNLSSWEVEVFTLSSRVWNMIPCNNLPRESIRLISTQFAIDKFIYWAACDTIVDMDGVSLQIELIVSFDLITKEFRLIDLPDSFTNQISKDFFISRLRDSLVLFGDLLEVRRFGKPVCGAWMMESDGVITSFRKLFTIDTPNSLINKILGFRQSDEAVIESQKKYRHFPFLEVYQPCSGHIRNLEIYGGDGSFFVTHYLETLLLLDRSDCSIYS